MAEKNYLVLCYYPLLADNITRIQPNVLFTVWYRSDFGLCFEYLAFSVFCGALFAGISALYAGIKHTKLRRRRKSWVVMLRSFISLCILLTFVVHFVGSFWLAKGRPYSVMFSTVVMIIAWTIHLFYLWVLSNSVTHYGRGPLNLNATWVVVFVGNILQLRTVIRWRINPGWYARSSLPIKDAYFSELSEITVYVLFGLQCLYGLTILLKVSRVTGDNVRLIPALHHAINQSKTQWTDDAENSVQQHLISAEWKTSHAPSSYGSITTSYESNLSGLSREGDIFKIEVNEDKANPLSFLSFWWVEPLMRQGSLGLLQGPDDLPKLPKSLSVCKLSEQFQRIRGVHVANCVWSGSEDENVKERPHHGKVKNIIKGEEGDEELESDDSGSWYDSLTLNMQGDVPSATEQIRSHKREKESRRKHGGVSLMSSLNRAFGMHYYPLGVLKLLSDMLGFAGPLLLHALVSFMENRNEPMSHGYYYALGLFLSTLLGALLNTHFTYQVNKVGLKIRTAIVTEIYRKALSISSTTLSQFSTGQVVNFMSTDSDRIVNFCASFHQFWSLPFQVVVSLALLYQQVGLAFLGGLVFCLLLIPVNRWLAIKIGKLSTEMMAQKDQRVKVMSEILAGIRIIKLYAWEDNFISKIFGYRSAELKSLKGRKYLDALCVYFWATTPVLISILTFGIYVAMGHSLTAAKVFTSIALFNILISPLNAFPWVINGLMEAWVSAKRVSAFLQLQELDISDYYCSAMSDTAGKPGHSKPSAEAAACSTSPQDGEPLIVRLEDKDSQNNESRSPDGLAKTDSVVVSIRKGSFVWYTEDGANDGVARSKDTGTGPDIAESNAVPWSLSDINITIHAGQFIGVIGKVGSGKSSLLSAIAAEMRKTYGEISVADLRDGFGLFAQEAWIQHATVQDNILFGKPFDAAKYREIISATALEQDLLILPAGDKTEVGENGATLSGGQKARIALARAIYQDKSVYLLDDPLAAVDAHVASHLYHHCINGLLRHKTRILCTHHIRFLREADLVISMEKGRVCSCGSPKDVLQEFVANTECSDEGMADSDSTSAVDESENMESIQHVPEVLVKEEEKAVGVVSFSVYRAYWSAVGLFLAPLIMLSLLLMQGSRNMSDWWLTYWITHANSSNSSSDLEFSTASSLNSSSDLEFSTASSSNSSSDLEFFLGIYGGLAAVNSVFTLIRAFLYAYGGICAAMVLHKRLLHSILMAPTVFFDTTPYAIDDSLPFILNILLAQVYGLLGTLAVTCYGLPWFTLLLLPIGVFYYNIQGFYRRTSRELKRLSTVTLSPVYAHFSETLTGLCTIRALRASNRFMKDNETKLEVNQRANYGSFAVAVWLGIRLQMLGVAMVTGVAFIAVLEHHFNTVNPGLVGLAISYALSVTNLLSGVVTSFTETEKEMVSVERVMQYIQGTPSEKREGTIQPPPSWPSRGVLEFKDVVLTYREGLPSALREVSFATKSGEKIGVVGRTGAGKSSLFKAIFRMIELSTGCVTIDGIDISSIPLDRLRSSLAIIPQDPFLFSGSIKENLDPCNKHSDRELWSVLEQCHLKEAVYQLGGLESDVEEKGRVFSVGQRQLLCLARALLTQARLICIDEATASVDQQTDAMIQKTIQTEFTSNTVITIAHRIETVMNSDRILVMDQGSVKEFAPPHELLENRNSLFSFLYREHTSKH